LALDILVGTVFQRTLVVATPMTEGLSESLVDVLLAV